jgi:hypothetical protein
MHTVLGCAVTGGGESAIATDVKSELNSIAAVAKSTRIAFSPSGAVDTNAPRYFTRPL